VIENRPPQPLQVEIARSPMFRRLARQPVASAMTFSLLAIAPVLLILTMGPASAKSDTEATNRSVAVLPLINLSDDKAEDYICDGVTETLINELSRIPELRVISRSSVFALKNKNADPREVGRKLGVATVLEGSVRIDSRTLRIALRLVSTADGRVIWTGSNHIRPLEEIYAAQDEIGCSVAANLRAVL
jgi:TolB-like protein